MSGSQTEQTLFLTTSPLDTFHTMTHFRHATRSALTLALLLSIAIVGCDAVENATEDLRTQEIDMELGEAGQLPLAEGSRAETSEVDGAENIPTEAFEVNSVTLNEEHVNYEPAASKTVASGTADVYLIVEQVPIVGATITVEDDEVTAIAPEEISIGDGLDNFEGCMSNIEGGAELYDDSGFSDSERESTLRNTLKQDSYTLTVAGCVEEELNGTLSIDKAEVEAEIGGGENGEEENDDEN